MVFFVRVSILSFGVFFVLGRGYAFFFRGWVVLVGVGEVVGKGRCFIIFDRLFVCLVVFGSRDGGDSVGIVI